MISIYNFVIMFSIMISLFGTNVKQADAYYCSYNETRCASAFLFYNDDVSVTTKSVYFSKGEPIVYQ